MLGGACGRGTNGAENRLTLSHGPDPIVTMSDEVGQKLPCGLAELVVHEGVAC